MPLVESLDPVESGGSGPAPVWTHGLDHSCGLGLDDMTSAVAVAGGGAGTHAAEEEKTLHAAVWGHEL